MKIDCKIDTSKLEALAERGEKTFNLVSVNAMNIAAFRTRQAEINSMTKVFDRPTNFTLNAVRVAKATTTNKAVEIRIRDVSVTNPIHYLMPQIMGGSRGQKRFEYTLGGAGAFYVPGDRTPLDSYGNPTRGIYSQILSQLQKFRDPYQRESAESRERRHRRTGKKRGVQRGDFFEIKPGQKNNLKPGVYQRIKIGRLGSSIIPIFRLAKGAPKYSVRFPFYDSAEEVFNREYPSAFDKAFSEAMGKL